jgi:hypothetical protein
MAYIGNTVQNQGFTPAIDYFNGNGVTVTFTLSRPIASVAQLIVAIDNVIQNPSSAFSVSGNSITFTSAPLSGTNNIWVEYTSLITTYAAISQDPSVIGDISATGGYLAEGDFGNTFIDGTIVDYVTGNARITTGPADAMTFYNGGTSARTPLLELGTTGNINIPGTGKRITGDFSNATPSNRVFIQTSTTNGTTNLGLLPNGIAQATSFVSYNSTDPANSTRVRIGATSTETQVVSDITGTGTYLPLTMYTGGSERLRIDTSGNVGIGTSVQIRSGLLSVNGVISNNNTINWGPAGNGRIFSDINWGCIFTADRASPAVAEFMWQNAGGTERMRIDTSGNLLVGTTDAKAPLTVGKAPSSSAYGQIAAFSAAAGDVGNAGISVTKYDNNTTTSQVFARFLVNQGATASGQINANGASAAAFGAYSDSRLKENVIDLPSQLDNIMALRPVEFDYIESEGGGHQIGFIAQEVNEIYPDLVGEREDGMLTLTDMNKNDARLIKAIQELKATVDEQAARIAALEAK